MRIKICIKLCNWATHWNFSQNPKWLPSAKQCMGIVSVSREGGVKKQQQWAKKSDKQNEWSSNSQRL